MLACLFKKIIVFKTDRQWDFAKIFIILFKAVFTRALSLKSPQSVEIDIRSLQEVCHQVHYKTLGGHFWDVFEEPHLIGKL